ncbi:MAG: type II toxin-antitoxin system Phd/YefM family antitoxin [Rickettsiales bacterium]|jgi:prevent-host-death family protein|nr:type II toxin-antitoxin system Phd/YefM family antitoxin [Rickettsiales bacterium]
MYIDSVRDIRPVSDFRQNLSEIIEHIQETKNPTIITVSGRPAVVIQDAEEYQKILDEREYWANVREINRAIDGVRAGNTISWEDAQPMFAEIRNKILAD